MIAMLAAPLPVILLQGAYRVQKVRVSSASWLRIGCGSCGFLPRYSALCHFGELMKASNCNVFKRYLALL